MGYNLVSAELPNIMLAVVAVPTAAPRQQVDSAVVVHQEPVLDRMELLELQIPVGEVAAEVLAIPPDQTVAQALS